MKAVVCLPKFGMQKSGSSLVSAIEHQVISEGACFLMPTGRHINNGGLFKFSVPACSHVGRQLALARHSQFFFCVGSTAHGCNFGLPLKKTGWRVCHKVCITMQVVWKVALGAVFPVSYNCMSYVHGCTSVYTVRRLSAALLYECLISKCNAIVVSSCVV